MIKVIATPIKKLIQAHNNLAPMDNEDQLTLELVDVDQIEGVNRISLFTTHIKLNGSIISPEIIELTRAQIDHFYSEVNIYPTVQKKCLTALQVSFACKTPDVFTPIYRSVFMVWKEYNSNSNNHFYSPKKFGKFYYYESGVRTEITENESDYWGTNYQQAVTIKHNSSSLEPYGKFIDGIDTMTVVFPFQTIYTLMKENNCDKIKLFSCMSEIKHQSSNPMKHGILLSALPVEPASGQLKDKYANRSHLCPPCNGALFGFDIA
jgi:hypothetical protein